MNRVSKGPAWSQVPFYRVNNNFWPSREELLCEAEAVRHTGENYELLKKNYEIVSSKPVDSKINAVIEWKNSADNTPVLNDLKESFITSYGNLGTVGVQYLYINGGSNYQYHRDNNVHRAGLSWAKKTSINCCLNIVLTDDEAECEFKDVGKFKYIAGLLNTSHLHRVKTISTRILARITFYDAIYEEVAHRIRKVDSKK